MSEEIKYLTSPYGILRDYLKHKRISFMDINGNYREGNVSNVDIAHDCYFEGMFVFFVGLGEMYPLYFGTRINVLEEDWRKETE